MRMDAKGNGMKIALIGATGKVGSSVLDELLDRGHEVVALLRDPAKLTDRDGLTTVKADALDADQVADAVRGADMVVSAYNSGWTNPKIYDDFMKGSRSIISGTKAAGVARLLVVGGAGSLYDEAGMQLVDRPDFPAAYHAGASAARDVLTELRGETVLDWTFLSPPVAYGSTEGVRTGSYRTGLEHPLDSNGGVGNISTPDLAVAIVDEVEAHAHSRKRFTVAS